MLAHKLTPPRKPSYPFYVQPKLNGIRAVWNGSKLFSRDLKTFSSVSLSNIYRALAGVPALDGELYCHGMSLQQINARVAVNRKEAHKDVGVIQYHVFDMPAMLPFKDRVRILDQFDLPSPIEKVMTYQIFSQTSEEAAYRLFKKKEYEGMMYRDSEHVYGFAENCGNKENRWKCLLKRKDWLDMDCVILGVKEGEGRLAGKVGAFCFKTKDGLEFTAGSGLNQFQREHYWTVSPVGLIAKINYEMLSDNGTPLKPTIEAVYEN